MKRIKQTNEERRSQAITAIINSARAHFALSGFMGASISAIAKDAAVNPSLIYHYFEDKEELWKTVKRSTLEQESELDFIAENAREDLRTFIERVMTKRFAFYQAQPQLLKIINWEQLQDDSRLYERGADFKWPWKDEIKRLIQAGEIRSDLDPELAGLFMISALRSVFTDVPVLYIEKAPQKQKEYLKLAIESVYRAFRRSPASH